MGGSRRHAAVGIVLQPRDFDGLGRGSIGKIISGLRLIRISDLGKPSIGQAIRRWLWGFFYILISPY
ncbi:hypothetical protein ACFQYP_50265 [Nonomuraea antimicrobica]